MNSRRSVNSKDWMDVSSRVILCYIVAAIGLFSILLLLETSMPQASAAPSSSDSGYQVSRAKVNEATTDISSSFIAPRLFTRGISEIISVGSISGVPNTPNHYSRGISENLGVSSTPPGSSQGARTSIDNGSVLRSESLSSSSASNKRTDEKFNSISFKSLSKRNIITQGNTIGGTPLTIQGYATTQGTSKDEFSDLEGASEAAEPDDNNSNNLQVHTLPLDTSYSLSVRSANNAAALNSFANTPYLVLIIGALFKPSSSFHNSRQGLFSLCKGTHRIFPSVRLEAIQISAFAALLIMSGASLYFAQDPNAIYALADTNAAGAAYRSSTGSSALNSPKYREWNAATQAWSSEVELPSTGAAVRDALILFSPISSQRVILAYNANGDIRLYKCTATCTTASNWVDLGVVATTQSYGSTTPYRPFYAAYESQSGKLVIAYDKGLTETNDFYWKTFDGFSLSAESGFNYIGSSADAEEIRYFHMASKSGSNEIAMVLLDATNQDAYAFVWNGTTFGTQGTITTTTGSTSITGEAIGVAYETSSGATVAFAGSGSNSAQWIRRSAGGAWGAAASTDPNSSPNNDVLFVSIKSDPVSTSNKIMICQGDDLSDTTCAQEDNGTLGSWSTHTTTNAGVATRSFDFAWNPSGSSGLIVYETSSSADLTISTKTWSSGAWGTATPTTVASSVHFWITAATNPTDADTINSLWTKLNSVFDVGGLKYDGTLFTLIGESTFTADTTVTTFEASSMAFQLSSSVPNKTATLSDGVIFTDSPSPRLLASRALVDSVLITESAAIIRSALCSMIESTIITDGLTTSKKFYRSPSDSLAVGDVVARTAYGTRNMSESQAISDTLVQVHTISRAISDTFLTTDGIAKSHSMTASLGDTTTITESIVSRGIFVRAGSDTLVVSEGVSRAFITSRTMAESVVTADTIARMAAHTSPITDTLGISDSIGKSSLVSKTIADALSAADSLTARQLVSRSIIDSVTTTDTSVAPTKLAIRTIAEAMTVTDSLTRIFHPTIPISDDVAFSVAVIIKTTRDIGDGITVIDGVTARISGISISGFLAVSDTVSGVVTARSVSGNVAVVDDIRAVVNRNNLTNDALSVTDSIARMHVASVVLSSDTVTTSDVISATVAFPRFLADNLGIIDALTTSSSYTRSISGALTIDDNIITIKSASETLADTLTTTDTIARIYSSSRTASDTVNIADAIALSFRPAKVLSDVLSATDTVVMNSSAAKSISNSVVLTDAITARISAPRSMSDAVAIAGSVSPVASAFRSIADSVAVSDSVSRNNFLTGTMLDSITMADTITRRLGSQNETSEALIVVDAVTARLVAVRSASDAISVTDNTMRNNFAFQSISDTIAVTESIGTKLAAARFIEDAITIAGITESTHFVTTSISDPVTIVDDVARRASFTRSIVDGIATTDDAATTIGAARPISDSLVATDATDRIYSASRQLADGLAAADEISAKIAARNFSDNLTVSDAVTARITAVGVADGISVTDVVGAKIVARTVGETLVLTETITAKVKSRNISDGLAIVDTLTAGVTGRSVTDAILFTDQLTAFVSRSVVDDLSTSDSISKAVTRTITDEVATDDNFAASQVNAKRDISDDMILQDSISKSAAHNTSDEFQISDQLNRTFRSGAGNAESIVVQDAVSTTVTRYISENMILEDLVRPTSLTVNITDTLEATDEPRIVSMVVNIADDLGIGDSARITSLGINIVDSIAASDEPRTTTSLAVNVLDTLEVMEQAKTTASLTVGIVDSLVVLSDQLLTTSTPIFGEQLALDDSISTGTTRSIHDSISVLETAVGGTPVTKNIFDTLAIADAISVESGANVDIADTLAVTEEITDVSVHWNRNFEENLDLQDCTPFMCAQILHFNEGLGLADEYVPPPALSDALSISDSISTVVAVGRNVSDNLAVTANSGMLAAPAPPPAEPGSPLVPLSVPVVTNTTLAGIPPSVGVNIPPLSWNGDIQVLKDILKPSAHVVTGLVSSADLQRMFIILPTYHVPITPTPEIPGNNVIVSAMVSEIPAGSPVYMPINFAETPGLSEQSSFTKWMSLEFTPSVDTTNFAVVVSVVDGPPGDISSPSADLKPLYLDIRWMGDFSSDDPSSASYYQSSPKLTFTVTDQWAQEQGVQRDENGVPMIALSLLNESTGRWEQVTALAGPTFGADGVYTYVATLPHFSHYAITATKTASPPTTPSGGSHVTTPLPARVLSVNIADSIGLSDSQRSIPQQVVEEFGGKQVKVRIADSLAILSKPVPFKTFQVGNVDVSITLQDIKQESIIPPKAAAAFLVQMANSGDKDEKFTLNFWYYDETGKKAWESSQLEELGPHESKQVLLSVPFTSPGVFDVIAEAHSFPSNELVNTTNLTVTVPWLTVNLYFLIVVAAAILGISGAGAALLLRRIGSVKSRGKGRES